MRLISFYGGSSKHIRRKKYKWYQITIKWNIIHTYAFERNFITHISEWEESKKEIQKISYIEALMCIMGMASCFLCNWSTIQLYNNSLVKSHESGRRRRLLICSMFTTFALCEQKKCVNGNLFMDYGIDSTYVIRSKFPDSFSVSLSLSKRLFKNEI